MTMAEIKSSEKETLTCADVASVLRVKPYTLHEMALEYPERLGFPVIVIGRRVRIPKAAFLSFMGREVR